MGRNGEQGAKLQGMESLANGPQSKNLHSMCTLGTIDMEVEDHCEASSALRDLPCLAASLLQDLSEAA